MTEGVAMSWKFWKWDEEKRRKVLVPIAILATVLLAWYTWTTATLF